MTFCLMIQCLVSVCHLLTSPFDLKLQMFSTSCQAVRKTKIWFLKYFYFYSCKPPFPTPQLECEFVWEHQKQIRHSSTGGFLGPSENPRVCETKKPKVFFIYVYELTKRNT